MAKGPSPRDDARRRGRDERGWDEPAPRRRRAEPEDTPWLDEGDYDDEDGPTHTLIGRRTLWGILFLLGVLTVGVVVGITLVSKRDAAPIDVPAVGEEVPVLRAPGPWKVPPSGPDVDGVPVEGQGQVLFGTGDGRETESAIAQDAMPEDPLPRPGEEQPVPLADEPMEAGEARIAAAPAPQPPRPAAPAPAQPKAGAPRTSVTVTPREADMARPPQPKTIEAPKPAAPSAGGSGQTLQLGAFSSSARAREAFKSLSGRYAYLAGMEPLIVTVASDGKTLYRLRTTAPSPQAARDICGRLKVAGEACSVVD